MAKQKKTQPNPSLKKLANYKAKFIENLTKRNIVIAVIVAIFLIQFVQLQRLMGFSLSLEGRDSSLITEVGNLNEAYISMGTDLNEIRQFLRMPERNYLTFTEVSEEGVGENVSEKQIQMALFTYMDYLSQSQMLEENTTLARGMLEGIMNSEAVATILAESDLTFSEFYEDEEVFTVAIRLEDIDLVRYSFSKNDGKLYRTTINKEENVEISNYETFENSVTKFLNEEKEGVLEVMTKVKELKEKVESALSAEAVQAIIIKKNVTVEEQDNETTEEITFDIKNEVGELVGQITINKIKYKIILVDDEGNKKAVKISALEAGIEKFLEDLDTMTFLEKKVSEAKAEIEETIFEDKGFKLLLSENGMQIAEEVREDDIRYYYDISDEEGTHLSSIVIEKATGVVNIVMPDGTNAENLLFFDPSFKKKLLISLN